MGSTGFCLKIDFPHGKTLTNLKKIMHCTLIRNDLKVAQNSFQQVDFDRSF